MKDSGMDNYKNFDQRKMLANVSYKLGSSSENTTMCGIVYIDEIFCCCSLTWINPFNCIL